MVRSTCVGAFARPTRGSGENLVNDPPVVDQSQRTVARRDQLLLGVDSKEVINGRGVVLGRDGVVCRLGGDRIRLAVNDPSPDAAAGEDYTEDPRPVIAARARVHLGGAPE